MGLVRFFNLKLYSLIEIDFKELSIKTTNYRETILEY